MKKLLFASIVVMIGIVFFGIFTYLSTQENTIKKDNAETDSEFYNPNYSEDDFLIGEKTLGKLQIIKSPYVTEYDVANGTWPLGILASKSGDVWIGGVKSHELLRFNPTSEKITSYPIPNYSLSESKNPEMIWSIIEDNDGLIWFSQTGNNPLWVFDPIAESFELKDQVQSAAIQLKVSPTTGDIWFTDIDKDIVGVIQKTGNTNSEYVISEFQIGEGSGPFGLYVDNDDYVWVTQPTNGVIYQYSKTIQNNAVTGLDADFELRQSNNTVFHSPSDVLVDENKIWFTEHLTNYFLEYDLESEELKRYPTSINPRHYGTLPFWMEWDVDGQGFWFVEHFGNRIAFFNTTNYTLAEYEIPTRDPNWGYISNAVNISTDPTNSDKLWFSELYTDKIGVVDASLSIPFDIRIEKDQFIPNKAKNEFEVNFTINVEDSDVPIQNNTLSLKKSSTIVASGGFGQMTAAFDVDSFTVDNIEKFKGKLILSEYRNLDNGNYTIALSVTDGTVTKTTYLDLIITA